jgi:hypothetical protein
MEDKIISFNFSDKYPRLLRSKVNEIQENLLKQTHSIKLKQNKKATINSWNQICGIMDRIDETLIYINSIRLGEKINQRGCFDLYEYIIQTSVIIDSIEWMAEIFKVDKKEVDKIKNSCSCFHKNGIKGEGNDFKYFRYIRSLVVAHPVETSYASEYIPKKDIMHICPFVIECDKYFGLSKKYRDHGYDYDAWIYTADSSKTKHLYLKIDQFKKYTNKWLAFIKIINTYIDKFNKGLDNSFVQQKIKEEKEFKNYKSYLKNLIKEENRRFGESYELEKFYNFFNTKSSHKSNNKFINKYLNSIKYSIKFYHNKLQNMNRGEQAGIKYPLFNIQSDLHRELIDLDTVDLSKKFNDNGIHYALEKTYDLDKTKETFNLQHGYYLFETHLLPIIRSFGIKADMKLPAKELMLLLNTALYFNSLTEFNLLNRNIPNNNKYRLNLLDEKTYLKLIRHVPKKRLKKSELGDFIIKIIDASKKDDDLGI